jgi:hypothetical protein
MYLYSNLFSSMKNTSWMLHHKFFDQNVAKWQYKYRDQNHNNDPSFLT